MSVVEETLGPGELLSCGQDEHKSEEQVGLLFFSIFTFFRRTHQAMDSAMSPALSMPIFLILFVKHELNRFTVNFNLKSLI